MLRPELYHDVYLIAITIITIVVCMFGTQLRKSPIISLLLCISAILFIGLRPLSSVFIDMVNYHDYYIFLEGEKVGFDFSSKDFIFSNLFALFRINNWPETYFFLVIALIYFGCMLWACYKLFPNNTLLAFLVCLAAFSTFSYGTNGIKAGASASIFLLAIAYSDNKWLAFLFIVLSYGFHHSIQVVIGAFIVVSFVKEPKYYFRFWIACLILAALHATWFQEFFGSITDESGAGYLIINETSERQYLTGFRLDFIIYSCVPIVVYQLLRQKYEIKSDTYNFIINLYTFTNGIWLLCMYASFTNRIAYLSWFMLPIVLIYPFLNLNGIENNERYLNLIVIGHLAFTLFMKFVYYA